MGTTTTDAAASATGSEDRAAAEETTEEGTPAAGADVEQDGAVERPEGSAEDGPEQDAPREPGKDASPGVGQGAGAVVSVALGLVSLTGSWVGTVAAARANLMGQLKTSQSAGVAEQVQAVYGDSWQITAVIGGAFALAALLVGAVVLARPAFGEPGPPQARWIKSVSWAGVTLGAIGVLLAVAKYTDLLLGLPATS
ncbi:hypothetical protein [Streptomyces sp. NPDC058045]|uniref:hypothetical protein n=1 Tax=Streptomyces sp. NPDC058045 TaxID=3346311 RepID=UPI0036EC1C79